jgi:hypothetical protein
MSVSGQDFVRLRASAGLRYVVAGRFLLIMVIALVGSPHAGLAQDRVLIPDSSIAIPSLQFDRSGALVIRASPTSSQHDFDYLVGAWKLRNRKLTSRLNPLHGVDIVPVPR